MICGKLVLKSIFFFLFFFPQGFSSFFPLPSHSYFSFLLRCPSGEHYAVIWEKEHLLEWGDALDSFLTSKMASEVPLPFLLLPPSPLLIPPSPLSLSLHRLQDIMLPILGPLLRLRQRLCSGLWLCWGLLG